MADETFMPTFSFWRSFHPSRTLHRVNWVVARLINEAALRDVANLDTYRRLGAAAKKRHLRSIDSWCQGHASLSRGDLLLEVLRTAARWEDLAAQASEAFETQIPGALEALSARMPAFADHRTDFAELCQTTHVPGALPLARTWLKESDPERRFWGSLILLRGDDTDRGEGLAELDRSLRHGSFELYPYALDDLLALGTPEAKKVALLGLWKNSSATVFFDTDEVLRRLFLKGYKECLEHLVARLTSSKNQDELMAAESTAQVIAWTWAENLQFDPNATPERRAEQRSKLAEWLRVQFSKIEKGETPDMKTDLRPIRRGRWRRDAP
jgi:hypothetical protein